MTKQQMQALYWQGKSLYGVYEEVQKQRLESPISPNKPILPDKHTSQDVVEYGKALAEYEPQKLAYEALKKEVKDYNQSLETTFESFCEDITGYTELSTKLKELVDSFLYEEMSYTGLIEKHNKLSAIVELINNVRSV